MVDTAIVTVIVPVYMAERYVAGALASVRDCTFERYAVIAVDAGGDDASMSVVERLADLDDRIMVLRPGHRCSAPQARNIALQYIRTPFVALLDADDEMAPRRLAEHVSALESEPDLVAVGGRLRSIDHAGIPLRPPDQPTPEPTPMQCLGGHFLTRYNLPFASPTLASGLTVRTDALRAVGGFAESAPLADDYNLIWRLCGSGRVRMLATLAGCYRFYDSQLSQRRRAAQELEVAVLRQRIVEREAGMTVPIHILAAWAAPGTRLEPLDQDAALVMLDTYYDSFVSRFGASASPAELEAIAAAHRDRRDRLAAPKDR